MQRLRIRPFKSKQLALLCAIGIIFVISAFGADGDAGKPNFGRWSLNGILDPPALAEGKFPFSFRWKGERWFALGDLHGDFINTLLLLNAVGVVNLEGKWTGATTLLIQTGDIMDRGPEGKQLYDFFNRLRLEARSVGGEILQLVGNHDVMNLCGDFRYVHPQETEEFGGLAKRGEAFLIGKYGRMLKSFPVAVVVDNVLVSHAGLLATYRSTVEELSSIYATEVEDNCALHNKKQMWASGGKQGKVGDDVRGLSVLGNDGPLWTRAFTMESHDKICRNVEESLSVFNAEAMVIGHTVQESGNIGVYCNGKLFAIDTGISRYVANQPRILEKSGDDFYEWKFTFKSTGSRVVPSDIKAEGSLIYSKKRIADDEL